MGGRKIQKEKSMEMQSKKGNTLKSHRTNTLAYSIKPKARVKYETTHSKNFPQEKKYWPKDASMKTHLTNLTHGYQVIYSI